MPDQDQLVKPRTGRGSTLTVREQVHQALTVLGGPAAPKLISAVHEAFFTGPVPPRRMASLRRDEERSFTAGPYQRPYYICAALTAERLAPGRGLLAVSTWPLERRIVGPLGPRTDFLTAAVRVAQQVKRIVSCGEEPSEPAWQLLRRYASNIPGAVGSRDRERPEPGRVRRAALAELAVHEEADRADRDRAAGRARAQLTESQRLFGMVVK